MRAEPRRDASSVMRPVGEFSTQVMRRHVDLARVSSRTVSGSKQPLTIPAGRAAPTMPTVFLRQR